MPCEEGYSSHEKQDVVDSQPGWVSCVEPQEVSPAEEEYLEFDYDSGIEESSQYVFSQRPYCRNTAGVGCSNDSKEEGVCCGGRAQGVKQGEQRSYACEQDTASRRWRLQHQQEESLSPGGGRTALVFLLSEARRRHLLHLRHRGTGEEEVLQALRRWRTVSQCLLEELDEWGYLSARMKFHRMYLFDLGNIFFDSVSRASELQRNKEKVLQQLDELKKQKQYFLPAEVEVPPLDTSSSAGTATEWEVMEKPVVARTSPIAMNVAHLNEPTFTACPEQPAVELDDALSPSLDSLPESGGWASSSPCSSDTEEYADVCCSPPTNYDSWLSAPCH
ncbi:hypothetical protein TraAM80_01475 [Trypanosoma rangeli]|uniref:Uncharacterized protein n=1 Tax=Trypanosoma rangeli TaxID=5698 RepID=A0A422NYI9_TRYRA|nr:uncharacterized protein TraAM80_01475 [Trypanosoma rangeli]RNF10550.1 hypothetical protein TraAM80_01475 [Trypanosoma rangeli]|eukprot:RNF10550.1 hypothetical protein TraAM80_01475 [Trypanosoma rangeli]